MAFRKAHWEFIRRAVESHSLESVSFGIVFQDDMSRDEKRYMAPLQRRLETEVKQKLQGVYSRGILQFRGVVKARNGHVGLR